MPHRAATFATALLAAITSAATVAWATETSTAHASLAASTAVLAPPTAVSATANCPNAKKGFVTVSWTASTSGASTGYSLTRATGTGAPVTIATLTATTTSYDDPTVTGSSTYTYAVVATYLNWTSAPAAATVTMPKHC